MPENEDTWSCRYCEKLCRDRFHLKQHELNCLVGEELLLEMKESASISREIELGEDDD